MDKKLLLVDDEEDLRDVLGIYLTDIGFHVLTAENGEDALRIFRKENPRIVLTDIKMPGMNGIELLQQIKNESPDTEVIMITGHGDMDLAIQSLKYEATDFVTKPINDDVLEIALKRANEKIAMRERIREYNEELHRLVQEELRNVQLRYQQLFDEVPCYISVQDKEFKITAANKLFKQDFGDGIGNRCYAAYKEQNEPCSACPVAKTFEDGESHELETVVTSKSGDKYIVLIRTAPIPNTAGEITQVMEMSTNITEIRQLQDHLSSLGLLIGSVSHCVKGLLTGLDGGMYLLNSGFVKENQEQIKEGWEIVKLMSGRIRKMVLDILYYAKERNLQWEQVDVLKFANDVSLTVEPKIRGQKIDFICDFDKSLGVFEIDPGIVSSALVNILENAVDACTEDKKKSAHKIIFRIRGDDEHILFEVSDNGTGMNKETYEKMFTLFFSSKGTRGTGLGLFISSKIIQQHGGTIKVDSIPGEGTRFSVRIPKTLPESAKIKDLNECQQK